jgi:DNA-binding NtrC family response regulator
MQRLAVREIEASHLDVRLMSTSSGDLAEQIRDGSFEPDLYAHLAGVTISVPALRDRREDIPRLARQLLEGLAPGRALGTSALQAFMRYSFPENLAELRRVLELGLSLHDGERLDHTAFSLGGAKTYRPPASLVPGGSRHH